MDCLFLPELNIKTKLPEYKNKASVPVQPFFPYPLAHISCTFFQKSSPQQLAIPGDSLGQNNDHVEFSWTLFIKSSGTQSAKNRSHALFSSFPWFFLNSRNSKNLHAMDLSTWQRHPSSCLHLDQHIEQYH
jgi:hypothetical protein